jgi:histidinol-phosphate aminotransferase
MTRPTIREDLASLEGYHSPQVDVEVRLNTNEAPGPPPAGFTEAVVAATRAIEWHRYPDRAATDLRNAIGALHHLPGRQVFCANGSNEVLQTILLTFAGPGRSVLTFEPTYAMHSHIARVTGARTIVGERGAGFELDLDSARALIQVEKPSVTFLTSPNNPTGIVESEATIRAVLDWVRAVGGLLVVDEAYGQFAPWSSVSLLQDAVLDDTPSGDDLPLVVTRTYSKTWAMAGARLGYLLGPAWLIDQLDKVVLPYHLDSMKQAAGLAALEFIDDMETMVASVVEERGRIESTLLDLGADVWPSGANFVLFRPPGGDGDGVWHGLLDRSVLVRNTASWERLDGCLRVTVGTPEDNSRFLTALAEVLSAKPTSQENA